MHLHNYFPELKQRLHAAGITAAALAAEANMAQTQLSRYFSGKVDARVSTLDALEEAFERLTNPEKSPRK